MKSGIHVCISNIVKVFSGHLFIMYVVKPYKFYNSNEVYAAGIDMG